MIWRWLIYTGTTFGVLAGVAALFAGAFWVWSTYGQIAGVVAALLVAAILFGSWMLTIERFL